MEVNLTETPLPRRRSAARAEQALADQLESDDSQSGGSDGGVKRQKTSKKGAGRGGKALKTYGKRGRPSAAVEANSFSTTGLASMEQEPAAGTRHPKPKPKPTIKRKRSQSLPISISSSPVKPTGVSVPSGDEEEWSSRVKNDVEPSNIHDLPLSDLTSLSSSSRADSPESDIEILDYTSTVPIPSLPVGGSLQLGSHHGSKKNKEPTWARKNLGSYVWVLIEPKSVRVFDPNKDENYDDRRMWWPGKITSPRSADKPLRVNLFKKKSVLIRAPSESNIVSKLDSLGRWRYKSPAFVDPSSQLTTALPRKRPRNKREDVERNRRDIYEQQWKAAVREMGLEEQEEQDSDDLPGIGEISTCPLPSWPNAQDGSETAEVNGRGKKKRKRKRDELSNDDVPGHSGWEPLEHDDTLQIPGELILAREKPGRNTSAVHQMDHWPAKILEYRPPTTSRDPPKYLIKWLDGTEGEVSRPCFYTMADEGFCTCKMGTFESSVAEVENDDENEDIEASRAHWDFSRRSPSPMAIHSSTSMEEFRKLSIRLQFAYTKPVLIAILNKEYAPVLNHHHLFLAGGPKRDGLLEYSSRRGNMDLKDVSELTNYLKEWCLRPMATDASHINNTGDNGRVDTQKMVGEVEPQADGTLEGQEHATEAARNDLMGSKQEFMTFSDQPNGGESRPSSPPATEPMSSPAELLRSSVILEHEAVFSSETISDPNTSLVGKFEPSSPSVMKPIIPPDDIISDNIPAITNVEVDQTTRRRQQGCKEFEVLTELEKLNYCTAILLPESIRQILLWKCGARTSLDLLSLEAEQELYDKGEKLLNETEWVFDIVRMRRKAENVFKKKTGTGRRGMQSVDYRE